MLVSLCKIGNNYVVDPTIEEEICGAGCIVVSVTPKGNVTAVLKKGAGSFMPDTLNEIILVRQHIFFFFLLYMYSYNYNQGIF